MPINTLPKKTPRGRGPEPTQTVGEKKEEPLAEGEETLQEKESCLADLETQALWESQEVGQTSWSAPAATATPTPTNKQ